MRIEQAIRAYLASRRQEGLSKQTIEQYGWHLREMAGELADLGFIELEEVSIHTLRQWGAALYERWAPATIKTAVVIVRSFFAWCVAEGLLREDPAARLRTPAVKLRLQRTMTAGEVTELIEACDLATLKGVRDAAMISLLADSGLRATELLSLKPEVLDLDAGQLTVVRKGGQQGLAFFGRATRGRLQAWMDVRQPANEQVTALWLSVGGATPGYPLTEHGLRIMLRRLGKTLGMEGVSPHAFRRGWACMLVEAGAPPRYIQGAGGWQSERQIYRYTQALELQRMAAQYSPMDRINENGRKQLQPKQLPLWVELPDTEG